MGRIGFFGSDGGWGGGVWIDTGRIRKCYVGVDVGGSAGWVRGCFQHLVSALVRHGHRLRYLLVECAPGVCADLTEALGPLAVLRGIGLVRFRSRDGAMFPLLRLLERLMMGDGPRPFGDMRAFWDPSTEFEDRRLDHPEASWLARGADVRGTTGVPVRGADGRGGAGAP